MSDVCDQRLDIEIVQWVATGPPDSYGRSINAVALAREVLALRAEADSMRNMLADAIVQWQDDREEIDRLRAAVEAFSRLCGCESDCEFDGTEIVHRPCCFRWEP